MAGRNDAAIAAALEAMAQVLESHQHGGESDASRSLATFQIENPPVFKGIYDPDGALTWLKEIERIFCVMDCTPEQKVRYGTHMLAVEADDWWLETRRRLEASGEGISWIVFRMEFLRKYFPEDVRGKKEIEFLELSQGNKSVVEYAAKFGELAKFYQYYDGPNGEFSKCIKFENGLRPEIKKGISYQKIRIIADLVDCCRIYEEDNNAHYRVISEKRGKGYQGCGKPYEASSGKGKQKVTVGKRTSGGDAPAGVTCFKCGKVGHKSTVYTAGAMRCYRCGEIGHTSSACKHKQMMCFNCGVEGHIGSKCQKPKKEQSSGKVFALSGTQTTSEDSLIRGTCFINSIPLITIIVTVATHCFIFVDCVDRLGLVLSSMNGEMVVDTPAKGSVTTSLVCLEFPVSIFDRDFLVDFVFFPLRGLDVILGMN